jgi:hypothetical protein
MPATMTIAMTHAISQPPRTLTPPVLRVVYADCASSVETNAI